jgi:hypothetical protein
MIEIAQVTDLTEVTHRNTVTYIYISGLWNGS